MKASEEDTKNQLEFWRKKALQYKSKYESLAASIKNLSASIKKTSNLKTLDPLLCLPSDVFRYITQHFTGSDYIRISEVSMGWNLSMASSKVTLDMIKLNLDERNLEIPEAKKSFTRDYKTISVNLSGKNNFDWFGVLKKMKNTVEVLEINQDNLLLPLPSVEFPQLKKLTLFDMSLKHWIIQCKFESLEELSFSSTESRWMNELDLKKFFGFVYTISTLKKLDIRKICYNFIGDGYYLYLESLQPPKFKLTELMYPKKLPLSFHDSQQESLEKIIIEKASKISILMALRCKNLVELSIDSEEDYDIAFDYDDEEEEVEEFPTNNSVKKLKFGPNVSAALAQEILVATPDIEELSVDFEIRNQLFEFIVVNMMKLVEFNIFNKERNMNNIIGTVKDLRKDKNCERKFKFLLF